MLKEYFSIERNLDEAWLLKNIPNDQKHFNQIILKSIQQVHDWVFNWVCNPNSLLGRSGPVCPFVPLAIKRNHQLLTYKIIRTTATIQQIEEVMLNHKQHFLKKLHDTNNNKLLSILVIFIPVSGPLNSINTLIKHVQQKLKTEFIQDNLMIGQFYPGCPDPGIHNQHFRPFDTPLPILVIRNLIQQDLLFITDTINHIKLFVDKFKLYHPVKLISLLQSARIDQVPDINTYIEKILPYCKA